MMAKGQHVSYDGDSRTHELSNSLVDSPVIYPHAILYSQVLVVLLAAVIAQQFKPAEHEQQ
jgi:hypothetical protein